MEIKEKISEIPTAIQNFAKRSVNLFPPIAKDCTYRLLMNKVAWVIIVILLLPCILGLVIYYETEDSRQVQNNDGEKIYYNNDGNLIHEEKRIYVFYLLKVIYSNYSTHQVKLQYQQY